MLVILSMVCHVKSHLTQVNGIAPIHVTAVMGVRFSGGQVFACDSFQCHALKFDFKDSPLDKTYDFV
jgi:hypothetical protein